MTELSTEAQRDWTPIEGNPYGPTRIRYLLAFCVFGLLAVDLLLIFVLVFVHTISPAEVDAFTATLLIPIIGLVGPVVGFYFGSKSEDLD